MDDILKLMQENGLRSTPQRRIILEILKNTNKHLSAEEIFEEVKKIQPDISFGTIYRNLSILHEVGIIRDLNFKDGKIRYELNDKEHHHHMVCINCGETIKINKCPMDDFLINFAKGAGFQITGHTFEVFGYCKNCQEKL